MHKTVSDRNDDKFRTNTQDQSNPIEIHQTPVLDIEQMQANGSAWAATPVLGRMLLGFWPILLEQHSSGILDEGYLADTLRYREELRNSDGDGFRMFLIRQRSFSHSGRDRHGWSPFLSNSLHVISSAILWVRLVGIQFLEKQFFFCYKLSTKCFFGRVFVSWIIVWLTGSWSNLSCTCNVKRRNISAYFCFETPRFGSFGRVFCGFYQPNRPFLTSVKMTRRPLLYFSILFSICFP
jgi:hypothetical protein